MNNSVAELVDLMSRLSRPEAIELLEKFKRLWEQEAALQSSSETAEYFLCYLRKTSELDSPDDAKSDAPWRH